MVFGHRKSTMVSYQNHRANMVEARGVEPLSENPLTEPSTSVVAVLVFPLPSARRQAHGFGSFIKSRLRQSLRRLVPHINHARLPQSWATAGGRQLRIRQLQVRNYLRQLNLKVPRF